MRTQNLCQHTHTHTHTHTYTHIHTHTHTYTASCCLCVATFVSRWSKQHLVRPACVSRWNAAESRAVLTSKQVEGNPCNRFLQTTLLADQLASTCPVSLRPMFTVRLISSSIIYLNINLNIELRGTSYPPLLIQSVQKERRPTGNAYILYH